MKRLPRKPSLDHLKKQAKDLLSRHREGDPEAVARVQATLPRAVPDSLRLHDAQACIARDYGFASWTELKRFVALSSAQTPGTADGRGQAQAMASHMAGVGLPEIQSP